MSLATGQALGPYTILAPLGAGGMGEVYRAREAATQINRSRTRLSVFGISRDAKYYVHTYARLVSDLDVVEGLK